MTDLRAERIQDFQYLDQRATKYMSFSLIAALGFFVCLVAAAILGAGGGWPWLLGAVALVFASLWSLMHARYLAARIMFLTLSVDLAKRASEASLEPQDWGETPVVTPRY